MATTEGGGGGAGSTSGSAGTSAGIGFAIASFLDSLTRGEEIPATTQQIPLSVSGIAAPIPPQAQPIASPAPIAQNAAAFALGQVPPQLTSNAPLPISADATEFANAPRLGIEGAGVLASALSAAGIGVAPQDVAEPIPEGGVRPGASGQFGQGGRGPQPAAPPAQQTQPTIEELKADIEARKAELKALEKKNEVNRIQQQAATVQAGRVRAQQQQRAAAQAQQQATGGLFPPGASPALKGALLADLIIRLNASQTPAVLQGRFGGRAQGIPSAAQLPIAEIVGATAAINSASAQVSTIQDPQKRDAMIDLKTQQIASKFGIPVGDARVQQIRAMVASPSPIPNLQDILGTDGKGGDPRLADLKGLILSGTATGEQIFDLYNKHLEDGTFEEIAADKDIAGGLEQQTRDVMDQFKGKNDGRSPETIAELRTFNASLGADKISDSGLRTLEISDQLQQSLGLEAEKTTEATETERIKRESDIEKLKATESQFTRDIAGLVDDGIISQDTANALRAQKAVTSAKGKGLQITFDEDGRISSISEGGATDPTLARGLETMQDRLFQVTFADHLLGQVEENITGASDEAKAGLTGILKRRVQTGVGIVADIDRQLNTNLQSYVTQAKTALEKDFDSGTIKDEKLDSRVGKFLSTFDPDVATLKQLEFLIAYHTAGGSKRGNRSSTNTEVKQRQDSIGLSKARDADSILASIRAARVETSAIGRNLSSRISARGGTPIPFEPGEKARKSSGLPYVRHFDLTGDSLVEVPRASP